MSSDLSQLTFCDYQYVSSSQTGGGDNGKIRRLIKPSFINLLQKELQIILVTSDSYVW